MTCFYTVRYACAECAYATELTKSGGVTLECTFCANVVNVETRPHRIDPVPCPNCKHLLKGAFLVKDLCPRCHNTSLRQNDVSVACALKRESHPLEPGMLVHGWYRGVNSKGRPRVRIVGAADARSTRSYLLEPVSLPVGALLECEVTRVEPDDGAVLLAFRNEIAKADGLYQDIPNGL
jgi:hypothetical protein